MEVVEIGQRRREGWEGESYGGFRGWIILLSLGCAC